MRPLPIQPTYTDTHGTIRFRENHIVRYLLDHGGLDLHALALALPNEQADWEQFAQLIGYSLSGFGDLSYVRDETYAVAEALAMNPAIAETQARLDHQAALLAHARAQVKQLAALLFHVNEDDLQP